MGWLGPVFGHEAKQEGDMHEPVLGHGTSISTPLKDIQRLRDCRHRVLAAHRPDNLVHVPSMFIYTYQHTASDDLLSQRVTAWLLGEIRSTPAWKNTSESTKGKAPENARGSVHPHKQSHAPQSCPHFLPCRPETKKTRLLRPMPRLLF